MDSVKEVSKAQIAISWYASKSIQPWWFTRQVYPYPIVISHIWKIHGFDLLKPVHYKKFTSKV